MANKWHKGRFYPQNKEKYIGDNINKITYRSSWELKMCEMCDQHPNVVFWASESLSIKYRHPFTKKVSNYVPDFFIIYMDARGRKFTEIVEVKPMEQSNPKYAKSKKDKEAFIINQAKWEAAKIFCKKRGIKFRIITEADIYRNTKYSKGIKKNRPKQRRR